MRKRRILLIAILVFFLCVGAGYSYYIHELIGNTYNEIAEPETYGLGRVDGYILNWNLDKCLRNIDLQQVDLNGYIVFDVHYDTRFMVTHIIVEPYLDDRLAEIQDEEKYYEIIKPYIDQGITFK